MLLQDKQQVVIEFSTYNHSIAVVFKNQPQKKQGWKLIDSNQSPLLNNIFSTTSSIANKILQSFLSVIKRGYCISMGTNIYTTEQYNRKCNLRRLFLKLYDIPEHNIIPGKLIVLASGNSWLLKAASMGHLTLVSNLLAVKAEINCTGRNSATPLYLASFYGHIEIVRLLLQAGADINKPTVESATPLFIASKNGHTKVVQLLITAGANIPMINENACNLSTRRSKYIS